MNKLPKEIEIQINSAIISKFPKELASHYIKFLIKIFRGKYAEYFPVQIKNEAELLYLIHLGRALESLENCSGFSEHIKEYNNNVDSSYFVTVVADYLKSISTKIELEPSVEGVSKKADILARIQDSDIYFECKDPKHDILAYYSKEHEEMYSALCSSIEIPCDVSVSYSQKLSQNELVELGLFIKRKLPKITGEGTILDDDGIKVEITSLKKEFINIGDIKITRFWENYQEKALYPGSVINRNGIPIAFFRTDVNAFNNIEEQIRNSKNKVPKNKPLVAVIHSIGIPGKLSDNVKFVSSLFNENKYTSFNGVLFVKYCYNFEKIIEYELQYVNNPFATNQIPNLTQLFRSTIPQL